MENNNNKTLRTKISQMVLAKINKGELKMKPRVYFILKTLLFIFSFLLIGLFVLFLISFIAFALRASGLWYVKGFGFGGFRTALVLMPWFLILLALLLTLLLEKLTHKFAFAWKRPIIYSALALIVLVILGGCIIDQTPLHRELFRRAQENHLPIAGGFYRGFGAPDLDDVFRGEIEEVLENSFKLKTMQGESLEIIISQQTNFPPIKEIMVGDEVVVFGQRSDGSIEVFGLRKVFDDICCPPAMPRRIKMK